MDRIIRFNPTLIVFAVPLLIMLSMIILSQSSWFQLHPAAFSAAITIDLAFTVPLVYLFLIRKRDISNTTAIPLFIVGLVLASFLIPADHQVYLRLIKQWVVPVVELAALALVGQKVRKILKAYNGQKSHSLDFHSQIREATKEVLPKKVSTIFAFEISLIYYCFLSWKKRKLQPNEFTYHKKSGTIAILAVLIGIVWVETLVIHILLERWSPLAAWILTVLSLYSGFQIFGMLRSLSKRPLSIQKGVLLLRYGIMSEATIPLDTIQSIELSSRQQAFDRQTRKLSPLGDLESHNVLIHLKEENKLQRLYGIKKTFTTIALHVDEKERFEQALRTALQENRSDGETSLRNLL